MMTRFGMSICALACFGALNSSCVAQDNPWNGSWKADASTMKYDGPTFSVESDKDGYTVTREGKASPRTVCDGQPKATAHGEMTTCIKNSDGYKLDITKDGKPTAKVMISLSANGKMVTRKIEVFPAGESSYTITNRSRRVSGGPGFSGVWKETGFEESQDTGVLSIKVDGDSLAFKETDNDKPLVCKLDGTPTKFGDARTVSAKLDGSHVLKVTYSGDDGKVQRENTFVLSPNGKTIKETDVTPEPSHSTMSLTLDKE
jgi:hypothetical protein